LRQINRKSETIKEEWANRKRARTKEQRKNKRTKNERTKKWKNDWDERTRLQAYAALIRSSIVTTSRLFNDWWDKIINIKSIKLINSSFNEKNKKKRKTSESFSLSFNVERCRKWCIDIRYNFAMLSDSAYFIQRRAHQTLEFDEFFVDNWKEWWRCWFCINWFHQSQNQSEWTIARLVVYLINIVAFTSYSLIVFFTSAHSVHLREWVFIQSRLFVFKHNWQNVVASLLSLRVRATMTWWLWDWLKEFSMFMTNNLCSSKEWMIKWFNEKKKKTTKKCYFMFKITRSYFHIRRVYSFFSWSLIYVFDISFSSNEFFLHRFRQTTRIFLIFHSISRQTYEFDKLIDEHVSYSSLNNEKISLLRILCLIFFF
jgi:hypothetical protein